jgi:hypothetical protein
VLDEPQESSKRISRRLFIGIQLHHAAEPQPLPSKSKIQGIMSGALKLI